ncbi:related to 3-octaprenyl-4-hydroxybenzoate carboxy-lyase [Cephalotrichum gorgonifer]|uniref:Ferulic acid decarboxylase 1 n=1 Tax=Cephalotrichum gorgonifer TaxID=2041049 RepID=A0AAE8N521_9PEZI|nr:related to 3-octaprenyl-4-hydroxybenzoate carboxy-lyase [Cephalotrichum gorgonifer]
MSKLPVHELDVDATVIDAQLDFRAFIDLLRQDGDLAEIDREVDPHLEVGAIVRRVSETNNKAPLFNNIKGAKNGVWRMFGNAASLSGHGRDKYGRVARNLGLPRDASWRDICARTQSAKGAKPLEPRVLETGPCKENKILDPKEIDLHSLPAPLLHQEDGGKYIQTYGVHILQTPDESWTNWSIFRGMIHDKNHIVAQVNPRQHNYVVREKWREQGKTEVPWALAFGIPPAATMAAAMPIPEGVSEGEYVGAIVGEPLDVVKCELSNLMVPANSEIVMEGFMSLNEKAYEGPFGDYLGYAFDDDRRKMPLFRVEAITYRNNPIFPVSVPGRITDESHTTSALAAAEILTFCKNQNLPIRDAYAPLETMATWCVLQIDPPKLRALKTNSRDFCTELGNVLFHQKCSMLVNRFLLVGDDIDIYDFNDITWAFVTRCRPVRDDYAFDDAPALPLTPYQSHGGGDPRRGGKTVSDCLFAMEYTDGPNFLKVDFATSYPAEIQEQVLESWKDMGFND